VEQQRTLELTTCQQGTPDLDIMRGTTPSLWEEKGRSGVHI